MKKKSLIIRFGTIGDVVHTTIIQQSINQKYPDCEIHFLTASFIAPMLEADSNLTKVYKFEPSKKNDFVYLLNLGLQLRKEKFDVIFNLQNSIRNRFLTLIANPKRIIYRSKNRIHAVDAFFNSAKELFEDIEKPKDLKLFISPKTITAIESKIKNYARPFIVINPGGENDNLRQGRIWPLKNWIDLSNKLIEKHGGTIFIVGSTNEQEYHKELLSINSSILFSGKLKLDESAALFSKADLFISGDSGPLHMASALGVNVLVLMGSTHIDACGPYGTKSLAISNFYECITQCDKVCHIEQKDIYKPCMTSISVQSVLDFIENDSNIF